MEFVTVILLGIIEGITEFLPISSTGHLIVAGAILDLRPSLQGTFEVFIQIGAVVAVLLHYGDDLWRQARQVRQSPKIQRLWLALFIAFLPAAVIGFLVSDVIDELLFRPTVVAVALIAGGVAFLLVERSGRFPVTNTPPPDTPDLTLRQAFFIGCYQLIALIPGMSRSGMSILGGLFVGLDRQTATVFSFYLAIPTLGSATIYAFVRNLSAYNAEDLVYLISGAVVAGVVAWASITWLLRYITHHTFIPFGYYRIMAGSVILVLAAAGIL